MGRKRIEEGLEAFGKDRIDVLSGISRALGLKIESEMERLTKRAGDLGRREELISELSDYFVSFGKIIETRAVLNATEREELVEMAKDVGKMKRDASERLRTAQDRLFKAGGKLKDADKRYGTADKLASFFEKEADREKHRLTSWAGTIRIREKAVASEKRRIKEFEKELDQREGWLDDREKTLGRTIKRLGLEEML